ncbi:DUF192 domain-containing protein [Halobellus sp. EA9]|uniref:DUF192 domain-containing protein n=1 Tax=Halobellus sp. EA9 TaxID=3421647 RepID=UPI003EBDEE26
MRRRTYLGLLGAAAVGASGCAGAPSDSGTETGTEPTPAVDTTSDVAATGTETSPTATADTSTGTPIFRGYETTVVEVRSPNGDLLGSVTAAIADTGQLRYRGLSETESLPANRGMLFVYDEVGDHTYVMRGMDFGLDIVYADGDGTITQIHHAPEPPPGEDGEDQRYPGRGQYVLEVNYGWTTDRGITEGDVLAFSLPE